MSDASGHQGQVLGKAEPFTVFSLNHRHEYCRRIPNLNLSERFYWSEKLSVPDRKYPSSIVVPPTTRPTGQFRCSCPDIFRKPIYQKLVTRPLPRARTRLELGSQARVSWGSMPKHLPASTKPGLWSDSSPQIELRPFPIERPPLAVSDQQNGVDFASTAEVSTRSENSEQTRTTQSAR